MYTSVYMHRFGECDWVVLVSERFVGGDGRSWSVHFRISITERHMQTVCVFVFDGGWKLQFDMPHSNDRKRRLGPGIVQ